jgi:hypothetical protein
MGYTEVNIKGADGSGRQFSRRKRLDIGSVRVDNAEMTPEMRRTYVWRSVHHPRGRRIHGAGATIPNVVGLEVIGHLVLITGPASLKDAGA